MLAHPLAFCFLRRLVLLSAGASTALTFVNLARHEARAASSQVAPANSREVMVYMEADETSPLIESLRDDGTLLPIAEMTGVGGEKWFMVKTPSGNVGWIKSGDQSAARRIDDHFRSLSRNPEMIGPAGNTSHSVAKPAATGAITIPMRIQRAKILVPVTFTSGFNSTTGNLVVDTGASRTMISKRLAKELRLLAVDTQTGTGLGVPFVADVGFVDSVKVGGAEVRNMRVTIHDGSNSFGGEGLLGFDFLGRFQMSVDTDKQIMVLTPRKQ